MPLPIPQNIKLASLPVESFFYGIFLLLFGLSTALFWYRHHHQHRDFPEIGGGQKSASGTIRPVLVLSLLISITVTGHWIVSWISYFASGASEQLDDDATHRRDVLYDMLKSIFIVPSVILADAAFIYRLWTVWGDGIQIIIFPCMTALGLLVTGSNIIMAQATLDLTNPQSRRAFSAWMLADIILTICTNIYCTAFISWKIWKVSKHAQNGTTRSNLQRVLSTVVESAAFYTTWMATAFGLNLAKSPIEMIFIDANSAVAGIAFMMINVRVGLGWAAAQCRTWKDATQESQFKVTAVGGLELAFNNRESRDSSEPSVYDSTSVGQTTTRLSDPGRPTAI